MPGDLELRTKHQFAPLVEAKSRWLKRKADDPMAQARFKELTGIRWAIENCALDAVENPQAWKQGPDNLCEMQIHRHQVASVMLVEFAISKDSLKVADLQSLHYAMVRDLHPLAGQYRKSEVRPLGEGHEPTEPELVPYVVANAMEWFSAASFNEMHEVEKTALLLMKMIDIHPFETANGRTLRLFSNFYLLRSGYPPAIIPSAKASQYAIAMQNSLRFHTQPLIDLLADSLRQTLAFCLDEACPPSFTILQ
ncbi:MAG: Fic family protein [Acidobacteriota bacterium]